MCPTQRKIVDVDTSAPRDANSPQAKGRVERANVWIGVEAEPDRLATQSLGYCK